MIFNNFRPTTLAFFAIFFCTTSDASLIEWQQQVKQKQLSTHPYWQLLLRYEDSQQHSIVKQADFFVSVEGATNPQQELAETLNAMVYPNAALKADEQIECKFPARAAWLRQQLNISPQQLPIAHCPALETWLTGINPYQATLVFAADYVNNPSSMFGHTLLRIDSPEQNEDTRLLAYAVNYAAQTNTANGLEFAYKGLTGGYAGAFSILPYYEKVKEYNDFENRDLWEYQLNLTTEEITQGLKHLWELKKVNFPYYFLSSNCSYQLLGLIEAARPNTYLRQNFPIYAIPTDTLRRVLQEKNILKKLVYRPANGTVLAYNAQRNSPLVNQTAQALALNKQTNLQALSDTEQARAYETAYDYLYYLYLAHQADKSTTPSLLRQLLVKRSDYAVVEQRQAPPQPATDPANGHKTARFMVNIQHIQQQDIASLEWRPAYQDLLDADEGYRRGAGIDFLRTRIGYNLSEHKAKLLEFTLLNIDSLATGNAFATPLSWSFAVGMQQAALDQQQFSDDRQHTVMFAEGGAGVSSQLNSNNWLCFALTQGSLQANKAIDEGWRIGAGARLGCRYQHHHGQFLLQNRTLFYSDDGHALIDTQAAYHWRINTNQGIRLQVQYQQQDAKHWSNMGLAWVSYF